MARGKPESFTNRVAIASSGVALAAGWLLVAVSSYCWVKTWRGTYLGWFA